MADEQKKPNPPVQTQTPTREELLAQIKALTEEKTQRESAEKKRLDDEVAREARENAPGWWRGHQDSHEAVEAGFTTFVYAKGEQDAVLQFCRRFGILYNATRKGVPQLVHPDKITTADLDAGAEPSVKDKVRVDPHPERPPVDAHRAMRKNTPVMHYNAKELASLGYSQEEIASVI